MTNSVMVGIAGFLVLVFYFGYKGYQVGQNKGSGGKITGLIKGGVIGLVLGVLILGFIFLIQPHP